MPTRREVLWGLAGATGALTAAALMPTARRALLSGTARGSAQAPASGAADLDDARAFHGPYGHAVEPPRVLGASSLDAVTIPPPSARDTVERSITISQRPVAVAEGRTMDAWTFDGRVPGPVLRVNEGETLRLNVRNLTGIPHNLHLHGAHDPAEDGWDLIPPASDHTYVIAPRPFGLYPYHCDVMPSAQHIGRGLYGTLIVDPPRARTPAHERVLVLGGFDLDGDGRSDLYGWNGVAGYFARFPLKVPVGELVRLYVVNLVPDEPVATFHLHAQTFDVFRSGTRLEPDAHTDVVALTLGERAVLECRFPTAGRYMFHPHQARMAERGAMGWVAVI